MNPKIFIGSSLEAKDVAHAISTNLQRDAECTVWTDGVFGLSASNTESLMKQVRSSDFGAFVFSPDDATVIRGKLFNVARDNVVYELGLFSGALGPERCFFLTPLGSDIHLPSDLFGMTAGVYERKRRDGNMEAAVGPFCEKVRKKIAELSFAHGTDQERLYRLAVRFECCEWIADRIKAEPARVEEKQRIFDDMVAFCQRYPVNKRVLVQKREPGFDVALAAAISANPENNDDQLVLEVRSAGVPVGFAQHVFVDAALRLATEGKLTAVGRSALLRWMKDFAVATPSLASKITTLRSMKLPD
jgi:hypothetical protein